MVCQIPNITNARQKVKQVIVELTDSGNPYKSKPSPDNEILGDLEEFIHIRDLCLDAYPALKCLDKERLNFTNELSYHEANVLTETLLRLKRQDIVAYPAQTVIVRLDDSLIIENLSVFQEYVSSFRTPM